MNTLNFLSKDQPKLKLLLPDENGNEKEIVLSRKRILAKDADAHGKILEELNAKRVGGELTDIEYTYSVIESMVDGFDRSVFDLLDIYQLREIADAVADLGKEKVSEKKSE